MSIFNKLFGKKENVTKSSEEGDNKFMPEIKLPVDERFTINFKQNGGKFLYCKNSNELSSNFESILIENNWQDKNALLLNEDLKLIFNTSDIKTTKNISEAQYFISSCEFLIADDGSLLISSNQIAEKKLKDLPKHFIIYATTSQFVETIGEGLKGIKANNKNAIPTNITTIKHFKTADDNDFLTYGSSSKNLYLLLLENF